MSGAHALVPGRLPEVFPVHRDGERRCSISGSSGEREGEWGQEGIVKVYSSWLQPVKCWAWEGRYCFCRSLTNHGD